MESLKEYKARWYRKNAKQIKERSRKRYEENAEIIKINTKKYRLANLEKARAYGRKHYKDNKSIYIERNRLNNFRRWKDDINYRLKKLISHRIRQGLKGIARKTQDTQSLLGCSIKELKQYIESKFLKGMTWENQGYNGWHIDHIRPCCSFDLKDLEQQKICFHYTNLQPLWAKDNMEKGGKFRLPGPFCLIHLNLYHFRSSGLAAKGLLKNFRSEVCFGLGWSRFAFHSQFRVLHNGS